MKVALAVVMKHAWLLLIFALFHQFFAHAKRGRFNAIVNRVGMRAP
jgi:hypothetical protein